MKVITIANRKGGTGKTTIAYNLGAAYALGGARVCFLDLDSQANLTQLCRLAPVVLDDFKKVEPVELSSSISILPATKSFDMLQDEVNRLFDRNSYMKNEILPKVNGFDYLIIDTAPSLSVLNINALCVSDMVHVVVHADSFSLSGLVEMRTLLDQAKTINQKLEYRIVLNAAFKNRKLTEEAASLLRADPHFAGVEIPNRQHVVDSNALKRPALDLPEILDAFRAMAAIA